MMPIGAGLLIVLPGATKCSFSDLQEQVEELMKKVEKSMVKGNSRR